jgi:hypothetical protein
MPSRHDVYGFRKGTLNDAATLVESALDINLVEGDSIYYGGQYYRHRISTDRGLKLYRNHDETTGAWVREEYPDCAVILEVDDLDAMDKIHRKLTEGRTDPVLLSSRLLPDEPPDEAEGAQ